MRLNRTAKLSFYNARKREGDVARIAELSGYSTSHVSNILAGRRTVNSGVANAMYNVARRRAKNSSL